MGGQAFATHGPNGEPPLNTPRMHPRVYAQLSRKCHDIISKHCTTVIQPADAPGKLNFGDIDFLVQGPHPDYTSANTQIAAELGARRTLNNNLDFTLAIPLPLETLTSEGSTREDPGLSASLESPRTPTDIRPPEDKSPGDSQVYAQVDMRYYPHNLSLPWIYYLHSYGDIGQILGYLGYELGLTSNDKGFHMRIAEQEKTNWARSMVFLSCDPAEVMKFLHLDPIVYYAGFATEEAIFDWIKQSRLAKRCTTPAKTNQGEEDDTVKRKTEHKRRMETRPMFSRFMRNVLPTLPLNDLDVSVARILLLQDALQTFNVRAEYEDKLRLARAENDDEKARLLLVAALVQHTSQKKEKANEVIRGIRRWVHVTLPSGPPPSTDAADDFAKHISSNDHVTSWPEPAIKTSADSPITATMSEPILALRDEAVQDDDILNLSHLLNSQRTALATSAEGWILTHREQIKDLERKRVKARKTANSLANAEPTPISRQERSWTENSQRALDQSHQSVGIPSSAEAGRDAKKGAESDMKETVDIFEPILGPLTNKDRLRFKELHALFDQAHEGVEAGACAVAGDGAGDATVPATSNDKKLGDDDDAANILLRMAAGTHKEQPPCISSSTFDERGGTDDEKTLSTSSCTEEISKADTAVGAIRTDANVKACMEAKRRFSAEKESKRSEQDERDEQWQFNQSMMRRMWETDS